MDGSQVDWFPLDSPPARKHNQPMIAERLPGISELSPQEKWLLASELWDAVAEIPGALPAGEAQKPLIRQRWQEYLSNPEDGSTWEEIKRKLGKA